MLNNINLNLMRTLLVLLEECHVSRTAARLCITQSAVSRQLAQLRELFDDPLLIRDGNNLHKTEKAQLLQGKLQNLLGELTQLVEGEAFEPGSWSGEVSFACSDYVAQYIFPEIVEYISSIATNATFNYHLWQPHLLDNLGNSPIKLASTLQPEVPLGLSGRLIGDDDLVCVMGKLHPLCMKTSLSLEDILSYQHMVITGGGDKNSEIDSYLRSLNMKRVIGLQVPFFSAAFNTLIRSNYLLIIPRHIARNMQRHISISYRDIPADLPKQKYWLIWHPKYDKEPAQQWVREEVFKLLQNSLYSVGYDTKS